MAGSSRRIRIVSLLAALALATASCAPAISFADLSDDQMIGLFPTAAEVEQAYGPGVSLKEPVRAPLPTETATASATATLAPGIPEECRAAYFGSDEANSIATTRGIRMTGDASDPFRFFSWSLLQHPSSDDAKLVVATTRSDYEPCLIANSFDFETENGFGATAVADGDAFSFGVVAVGDVTMTFSVAAEEEYEAELKKMAVAVERRLQAAGK